MKYLKRVKRLLMVAVFGSLLTVFLGELPLGLNVYPTADIDGYIKGFASISDFRLCLGLLCGSAGIAIQHYGFKATAEIVSRTGEDNKAGIIRNGAIAMAMFGGLVHALMTALMFVCRFGKDVALSFATYLLMPVTGLFAAFYLPMLVMIFIVLVSGKTPFPKWMAAVSPLIIVPLISALSLTGMNNLFFNGIWMAGLGIGNLIMFTGMLVIINKTVK